MKLVANVRRVSGHCRKRFQIHRITFFRNLGTKSHNDTYSSNGGKFIRSRKSECKATFRLLKRRNVLKVDSAVSEYVIAGGGGAENAGRENAYHETYIF